MSGWTCNSAQNWCRTLMQSGFANERLVQLRRRDGAILDCMVNAALIDIDGVPRSHAVWIARGCHRAERRP